MSTTTAALPEEVRSLDAGATLIETACGAGRMVWRRWGSGPPLVLLHGGYGSWMHWVRNIPIFMGQRTVYAPDLPGLGDSDEAPEPGAPADIAEVVVNGIAALGLDAAETDLVGFSFGSAIGGHVSTRLALRSLTLVGPGALGLPSRAIVLEREMPEMDDDGRHAMHRRNLALLMIADTGRIDPLAVAIQASNVPKARVKSRRFARTDTLAQAMRRSRTGKRHWIWGERDQVVGEHLDTRLAFVAEHHPDATIDIVAGAGHWVSYEASNAFNALLVSRLS